MGASGRVAAALFAAWAAARIAQTAQVRTMGDAGPWVDAARHARDGLGAWTDLPLDPATPLDPLWPWVLGGSAHVLPLQLLAHALPLVCTALAVLAAWGVGSRLWQRELFPGTVPGFHGGHLALAGLAGHAAFVLDGSLPFPEPLAWALLGAWAWRRATRAPEGWRGAIEDGLAAALVGLARGTLGELVLAAVGLAALSRVALGPARGRALAEGLLAVGLGASLLAAAGRPWWPPLPSPVAFVRGIGAAWDPASPTGYHLGFHTLHWGLAFALPPALVAGLGALRRDGARTLVARMRAVEAGPLVLGWLAALGLLAVHLAPDRPFATLSALPALPAFVAATEWLTRREARWARVAGALVITSTLMFATRTVWTQVTAPTRPTRTEDCRELARWLEANRGASRVVATEAPIARRIGWCATGVGFLVVDPARLGTQDTRSALARAGVRWVVVAEEPKELPEGAYVPVDDAPPGAVVLERR